MPDNRRHPNQRVIKSRMGSMRSFRRGVMSENENDIYDQAVQVILDSGLLTTEQMNLFHRALDGKITIEEFEESL